MSNPVSLAPLLERLKRTDAPTVEEACTWTHWHATDGDRARVIVLTVQHDDGIRWDDEDDYGILDGHGEPWQPTEFRPVPTVAELLALAALPGKVAAATRADIRERVHTESRDERPNNDAGEAFEDALDAIDSSDLVAIVAACAK